MSIRTVASAPHSSSNNSPSISSIFYITHNFNLNLNNLLSTTTLQGCVQQLSVSTIVESTDEALPIADMQESIRLLEG